MTSHFIYLQQLFSLQTQTDTQNHTHTHFTFVQTRHLLIALKYSVFSVRVCVCVCVFCGGVCDEGVVFFPCLPHLRVHLWRSGLAAELVIRAAALISSCRPAPRKGH